MTAAFGTGYWLTALQRHEQRPATRLLLCIVKAQYARLTRGVDCASECATLRDNTGGSAAVVFSTKEQALLRARVRARVRVRVRARARVRVRARP